MHLFSISNQIFQNTNTTQDKEICHDYSDEGVMSNNDNNNNEELKDGDELGGEDFTSVIYNVIMVSEPYVT
jgi:hypothetical protein